MKLIFKNATVVNATGQEVRDVFVEDGKIVGPFEDVTARVIDCTGKYLMPGAIDAHVHFREPGSSHKETWETGSAAAAMGGVTTVLDMPNNNPAIVTAEALEAKRDLVKGRSRVNYGFHFGATGGNEDEIRKAKGITGIKVYMGSSTGNLLVDDSSRWEGIFQVAKEVGVPVVAHAEDQARIRARSVELADKGGELGARIHSEIRDCECARIAADAAVALREKVGNKLHLAHMSCADEVEIIQAHADENLSCEVAPHHLYFSDIDLENAMLKMNPPLRTGDDVRKLWEAMRDGTITMLATDHAPHTLEEKDKGVMSAPAGVPGVEFLLPLILNEVNGKMIPFERLVDLLCAAPARVFNLKGKGEITVGADADLVLVDMEKEMTITRDMVVSKCGWSPYEGYKLKGWPVMTVVNGEVVMEDRELTDFVPGRELL